MCVFVCLQRANALVLFLLLLFTVEVIGTAGTYAEKPVEVL